MNLENISNLSAKAAGILKRVDQLIALYEFKPGHSMTIELWSTDYDALQKSVKSKLNQDITKDTYRGYKFTRKQKRARYSKKNFNQVFK